MRELTESSRTRRLLAMAVIPVMAILPYLGILDAPFVFDDIKLVKENEWLRPGHADAGALAGILDVTDRQWVDEEVRPNYRPLRFLSYLVDYRLSLWAFGEFPPDDPPVLIFHLTNVLLHALNAFLVFLVLRQLLRSMATGGERWAFLGAGWAALLFALHPLQTEAVTYISGRRDVLSTLCFLLGVLAYVRVPPRASPGLLALVVVPLSLVAGCLSKEMVVTLPAVLLLIDWTRGARWSARRILLHGLTWCVVAFFVWVAQATPGLIQEGAGRSWLDVTLTAARYVCRYLGLFVAPISQSVDYSFDAIPVSRGFGSPWTTVPSLVTVVMIVVVAGALTLRQSRGRTLVAFGLLWFVGTLAPVLQFIPSAEQFAERFAYLPVIGLLVVFAVVLVRAARAEPLFAHAVAGLVCLLALAGTLWRNADWESPLTLWTSAVEAQPRAARAHLARADALKEAGRSREALEEYTVAITIFEEKPDVPLHHGYILRALTERGTLYGLLGDRDPGLLDRAVEDFRRVLASRDVEGTELGASPGGTLARYNLAGVLFRQKKTDEARAEFEKVVEVGQPEGLVKNAHYYLAVIALGQKDTAGALAELEATLEAMEPSDPERVSVVSQLTDVLMSLQKYDAAGSLLADELDGHARGADRLHLMYKQAEILDRRGDLPGCMQRLEDILAMDPSYGRALVSLGEIEMNLERYEDAEEHLRSVPPRDPSYSKASELLRNLEIRKQLAEEPGTSQDPIADQEPEVMAALEAKGIRHMEKGEWLAAWSTFLNLLARARSAGNVPLQVSALKGLARVTDKFSRPQDAHQYLEEALRLSPVDPDALRAMGDLRLQRFDDREGASGYYSRYLSALPPETPADSKVLINLGAILTESDPLRAVEYYELALAAGVDEVRVLRGLGYAYARAESWAKSLDAFNRYLELAPEGAAERDAARQFVRERILPQLMEK